MANNLSFMNFLGFPDTIPDFTTIWLFRERLTEKGKIDAIMQELQRQLDARGLVVKEGSIQDATFITADPGRSGNRPRGSEARTRRSKDGHRPGKEKSPISGTSFITKWMLNTV